MSDTPQRAKQIFLQLLDLPAEQRPTHLDNACAGDPALRAEVVALLNAASAAGSFLERPADLGATALGGTGVPPVPGSMGVPPVPGSMGVPPVKGSMGVPPVTPAEGGRATLGGTGVPPVPVPPVTGSTGVSPVNPAEGGRATLGGTGVPPVPLDGARAVPPASQTTTAVPISEKPGSRIGPYKLLQQIGEGGFGVVFMAEQERPVRRRVALKVIKLGMDTRQVIARFEAERQALAMMDHPNIARVLDAGATETGRPYFVMELVRGVPITEYCNAATLTAADRLNLFIPVCRAIQHAHIKGVIHRDIKPSNVLVTLHDGKPVPKVIDFGIAKATDYRLTEKTLFTELRQMIGTPAYMSPEQAEMSGLDIDTRTDVYSLGVLLYELLTGSTPFAAADLLRAGYGEMQRIIREVEPPRPSTRVSTLGDSLPSIAAQRRTEPRRLGLLLRGDIDWITMKSLEKDRTRRYETVEALAADVQRHLSGEPVIAAPPSVGYRVRKLVRKHRGQVVAGSLMCATLFIGISGTTVALMSKRASDQRLEEAETRMSRLVAQASDGVERMAGELSVGVPTPSTGIIGPFGVMDDDFKAFVDYVDVKSELYDAEIAMDASTFTVTLEAPRDEHQLIDKIINAGVGSIRRTKRLQRLLIKQRDAAREARDEAQQQRAKAEVAAVAEFKARQQAEEQKKGAEQVAAYLSQMLSNIDAEAMGKGIAKGTREQVRRGSEAALLDAQSSPRTHTARDVEKKLAAFDEAIAFANPVNVSRQVIDEFILKPAIESQERALAEQPLVQARLLIAIGGIYQSLGMYESAERLFRQTLDIRCRELGDEHPDVAGSLFDLASFLRFIKHDADGAKPLYRHALAIYRKVYGEVHPSVAVTLYLLAGMRQSKPSLFHWPPHDSRLEDDARDIFIELHKDEYQNRDTSDVRLALWQYGKLSVASRKSRATEWRGIAILPMAIDGVDASNLPKLLAKAFHDSGMGVDEFQEALRRSDIADNVYRLQAYDVAEPLYHELISRLRRSKGSDFPEFGRPLHHWADTLMQLGRVAEAEAPAREAVALYRLHSDWDAGERGHAMRILAESLTKRGNIPEAAALNTELVAYQRSQPNAKPTDVASALASAADTLIELHTSDAAAVAETMLRECLALRKREYGNAHPETWLQYNAMSLLGGALLQQAVSASATTQPASAPVSAPASSPTDKLTEAEPLLVRAAEWMLTDKRMPTSAKVAGASDRPREAAERVIRYYDFRHTREPGRGYDAAAAAWRARLATWQASTQPAVTQPASQPAASQPASQPNPAEGGRATRATASRPASRPGAGVLQWTQPAGRADAPERP